MRTFGKGRPVMAELQDVKGSGACRDDVLGGFLRGLKPKVAGVGAEAPTP
jgi:hypothetical protein